jgi:hypothetical protein
MENIKPRINLAGYEKALREYGSEPARIIEELAANSYDADSTIAVILYSEKDIVVIDNGSGIASEQLPKLLDLGAGTKTLGAHESELKRSYLGSFGFGIKSIFNISKSFSIYTINKESQLSCEIDVQIAKSKGFNDSWEGFPIQEEKRQKNMKNGTLIHLKLSNEITPEQIENMKNSLSNLPKSNSFSIYFGNARGSGIKINALTSKEISTIKNLASILKKGKIKNSLEVGSPKTQTCVLAGNDTIDISVWCKGLDSNLKVPSLNQFAGVYVKVDGRVLKRNFQGEKVLDGISKYPKFKHGMRIEVPLDWVKSQINLGRDGLQFGNESSRKKFENELKMAVSAAVKPFAKQLEGKKVQKVTKELGIRLKKADERIKHKQSIKQFETTGYSFKPTDDYEMALLMANPTVIKKLSSHWVLIDFNGQADFDCLVFDKKSRDFIRVELEPNLGRFISQSVPQNTDFVVCWTKGDWKVGKTKRGKRGYFELLENKDGPGHYKLLIKNSERSKEPKQELKVFCIDKIFKV